MATTDFADLLDELETMAKSMESEGEEADEDEDAEEGEDGEDGEDAEETEETEDGDETLSKSFSVVLASGQTIRAHDASALIDALRSQVNAGNEAIARTAKATADMVKSLQGEIADLRKSLNDVSGRTSGRKSVINIHERRGPQPMEDANGGVTVGDFMVKAMSAMKAGRITGEDVAKIEVCIGHGQSPPGYLMEKVLS